MFLSLLLFTSPLLKFTLQSEPIVPDMLSWFKMLTVAFFTSSSVRPSTHELSAVVQVTACSATLAVKFIGYSPSGRWLGLLFAASRYTCDKQQQDRNKHAKAKTMGSDSQLSLLHINLILLLLSSFLCATAPTKGTVVTI